MIRKYIIVADDSIKGFDEGIAKLEREWGAEEIELCEDCISKQKAIDAIDALYLDGDSSVSYLADAKGDTLIGKYQAITTLDDLQSVTPKAEQKAVLDKIRAEIEQITDTMGVSYNQYVSKIDVLQIIDKYKAESEDKE